MPLEITFLASITAIDRDSWNSIAGTAYPFLRHEYLHALETSGSACPQTGWAPHHALIREGQTLIGVMPLYRKNHSYGEYVFDWEWARAYERYGLTYYPKLVAAIPFTPATGPRLAVTDQHRLEEVAEALVTALIRLAGTAGDSSLHVLFPSTEERRQWPRNLLTRTGVQYHWFNHGFASFDAFLETFTSRKRKNLRKERQQVHHQGLNLVRKRGGQINEEDWVLFYRCYQQTYAKRSGHGGYLRLGFFQAIASTMPDQVLLVLAYAGQEPVAAALNFIGEDTLYGRYWGCLREYEFLHFETCYYQGIEFCIEAGLKRFDPGAQGEHKIQRGFTPTPTYSLHWIADPEFAKAITEFLQREERAMLSYIEEAKTGLPFRAEVATE